MPDAAIRVVVVDDHAVVRRGLVAFFEGERDIEVVGAEDGALAALDLLARLDAEGRLPHVVLMDLHMPGVDGVECTRRLRDRWEDVQVVALTSFSEQERVHAALDAGAAGYLLKDAEPEEVAAAVRAAHRGGLQLSPAVARQLLPGRAELTAREVDIVRLLGAGKANKEIARELEISERTARTHVSNILIKLRLSSRTQAALWAVREGFVDG